MKMIVMRTGLRAIIAGAAAVATVALAGCGGPAADGTADGKLDVVASFYPLEFIARSIGGDAVHVTTLTAPGVEPHDLELTPKQVATIAEAKVVVYEKTLQPAVDEAVAQNAKDAGFDVAPAAQLEDTGANFEEHQDGAAEAAHKDNALDPHFWLDPVRYAAVVKAVEEKLASVDSKNAAGYHERAQALLAQVGKLDTEYKTGLANCKLKTFVTSHEAFAYMAKRYGLTMVGIAGFTPDAEPTPTRIKEVQDIVKAQHVTTIFYEELVSPKVAETIAHDVGVKTAVLSPIEGLSDANSKETYLTLMQENLQELRTANGCS
ncbi:zinc transport system substrate-binding protein [Kribbella jejuensis]|uniref:Zinc transport system substrate-binding protein n=2 Tax=Kribbella jejuensis TaxID=236068 RepID=A0A542EBC1_9ACTN|nr:zinc transport system substrate-binding protein [Kribbella jejuensis]